MLKRIAVLKWLKNTWYVLVEIGSTPKGGWGGIFRFTGFQGLKSVQMFELFL